jgi:hypothetical protein
MDVSALSSQAPKGTFAIGICATGRSPGLAGLTRALLREAEGMSRPLTGITIVASECPADTLSPLRAVAASDARVRLVIQEVRRGKADAVNQIARMSEADFLVFVNSDASPEPGSLSRLVEVIYGDPRVGVVSAAPTLERRSGATAALLRLMWSVHNATLLRLNHEGRSNHSSDEMMAVRSEALSELPPGTVNDGAFIAGFAHRKGYSIRFLESARVRIDVPRNITGLFGQLRRIIFGHVQVMGQTGEAPRTAGSILFLSPLTSLRLIVGVIAREPGLALALPLAALTGLLVTPAALVDVARSSTNHGVWRRFEGAS